MAIIIRYAAIAFFSYLLGYISFNYGVFDYRGISRDDFLRSYWPFYTPFISGAIGGALPACALWFTMRSFKVAQERLRREKAIEVIRSLNSVLTDVARACYKIAEGLDDVNARLLDNGERFSTHFNQKHLLTIIFRDVQFENRSGKIIIPALQSFVIRSNVLGLLNAVEIACAAWVYDVSNSDIIEEEIAFLYDPAERNSLLERLRHVTRSNGHYPNIVKFTNYLKHRRENPEERRRIR